MPSSSMALDIWCRSLLVGGYECLWEHDSSSSNHWITNYPFSTLDVKLVTVRKSLSYTHTGARKLFGFSRIAEFVASIAYDHSFSFEGVSWLARAAEKSVSDHIAYSGSKCWEQQAQPAIAAVALVVFVAAEVIFGAILF
ncbi:hypothetical protein Tco_0967181 [Tanacetum coccineum]